MPRRVEIVIDKSRCKKCLNCVRACTAFDGVYEEGPDGYPVVTRPEECIHCLVCHSVCPTNAITHRGLRETVLYNPDKSIAERYKGLV